MRVWGIEIENRFLCFQVKAFVDLKIICLCVDLWTAISISSSHFCLVFTRLLKIWQLTTFTTSSKNTLLIFISILKIYTTLCYIVPQSLLNFGKRVSLSHRHTSLYYIWLYGFVKQYNQELCISSITRCFTKRLHLRPLKILTYYWKTSRQTAYVIFSNWYFIISFFP